MSESVIVNGQFRAGDPPMLELDNRAFHYGDGIFESIRVIGGRGCALDAHWARLSASLEALDIRCPEALDRESLERFIKELAHRNSISGGRCRLTIFRDSPGHYRPADHKGSFTLEVRALDDDGFVLNERGLHVDIYPDMRKPVNLLAVHKTLNCLPYVMASLWSQERGLDDCLLQNDRGNIIENSGGNLFIVSNGVLYTPALSDGCVGGVMRMRIINLALGNGIKVYECSLNPQNLLAADELFFTNAVQGIRWVSGYRTKRYGNRMSQALVDLLGESEVS